jgi:hypothetical protein
MQSVKEVRHRLCLSTIFFLCSATLVLSQSKREIELSSSVSQDRLLRQVRDLVQLGPRTGGTRSGDRSAAYIAKQFRAAGYSPTIYKDPKRLAFELRDWDLQIESPKRLRGLIKNEWVGAYSPSVPKRSTPVMYLQEPESVPDSDIQGKAVLLDNPVSEKLYHELSTAGARCLLVISPDLVGAYSDWAMITDLPEASRNPIPLFNLSRNNGSQLKRALRDSQVVSVNFFVRSATDSGNPKTVIVTLEGKSQDYYLVCAHGDSDSGGPGADDNASGVSAVLETARVLKMLVKARKIPKPEFTIVFAVWGMEMFSTQEYVRREAENLGRIAAVLNIDEVGTGATRNCLYFESNDVSYNAQLLRTLEKIGEQFAGKKGYWSEATTNPSLGGGTDAYVFFPRFLRSPKVHELKIPSITIFTGAWNELKPIPQTPGWTSKAWKGPADTVYIDFSAYYHSSLDVPERTTEREPFNMVGAVKALGIGLLRLAW